MKRASVQRFVIGVALCMGIVLSAVSTARAQSSAEAATSAPPTLLGRSLTVEEAARSGLNKLTAQELAYLEAWLSGQAAERAGEPSVASVPPTSVVSPSVPSTAAPATSSATAAADPFDKPKQPPRLVARVLPPFTGWEGQTEFRLDNGQVWRQRLPGRYVHKGGLESPTEVVITRNFFGFFVMTVPASGRGTGVERIR